jgi:nucleotide-binding universal stress UspA family protein
MKKILATTDFSETANKAIDYAVMIAKGQKTPVELELLNVHHITDELENILSDEHIQKLSRHELFDISMFKHFNELPLNVSIKGILRRGPVAATIVKEAKEGEVNLIVIGRNGYSAIKDWMVGTTATQIINHTDIPIIAIPKLTKISPPKKIALAIDDKFVPSDKTLLPLFNMVTRFNTELVLFHVEQKEPHSNTHKETAIKIARKGYPINLYKMDSEHSGDALMALSEQHDVDLLCVIKHDLSSWEKMLHHSISNEIVHKSPIPFMILHDVR